MIRDKADFRNTHERLKVKGDSIWRAIFYEITKSKNSLFFFFKANEVKIVNIHERHNEDLFPRKFFWKLYHTKVKYKFKFKIEQFSWFYFLKNSLKFAKEVQISIIKRNQKADFPRKFSRLLLTNPKKKNLRFN